MPLLAEPLLRIARRRALAAGQTLFRQGDAARGVYALARGRVHLLRHTPDGSEVLLHRVRPGETFAEASLFADFYHCDCLARAESEVLLLPKKALLALLRDDPAAMRWLYVRLAAQVRHLRARLELRNVNGAEERVLAALRLQVRGDDARVELEGTWKDFAAEIGLAHETLYRALARLRDKGLIRRRGRSVWLLSSSPRVG